MSTRAKIKVNGVDGSNDDVPINVLVTLANDGLGGETTFLWTIVDQPEGAADSLSSSSVASPTFTPKKEGSYLIRLTVNASLSDEATNQAIVAVRQLRTNQRVPAAQETLEDDSTAGWKLAANRQLQLLDKLKGDSNLVVAWSHVGAVVDQCVKFAGTKTIKAGLPGEEIIVLTAAAGAGVPVGVIVGPCKTGGAVSDNLVFVRGHGLHENARTGDPAVGDGVFVNSSTSLPSLTGSTEIGRVVAHDGAAHTYRFAINFPPGSGGGGGGGVNVDDNGTPVLVGATTLNFIGFTVAAGGGVASITGGGGGGVDVDQEGSPIATASIVNFVGMLAGAVVDAGGGEVQVGPFDYFVTFDQDVFPGSPVCVSNGVPVGGGAIDVAFAGAFQINATVIGFSLQAAGASTTGYVRIGGQLALTTAQWDLITGGSGGLSSGAPYFLSDVGAGEIVSPGPTTSGSWLTPVGVGLLPTTMLIRPEAPTAIP